MNNHVSSDGWWFIRAFEHQWATQNDLLIRNNIILKDIQYIELYNQ